MTDPSSEVFVHGVDVDAETRCAHWHSPFDIVAIKFKCCGEWYSCYECHRSLAGHEAKVWDPDEFVELAIFCGACESPLTIEEYVSSGSVCPCCQAAFNPGCVKHYGLYFSM